MGSNEHLNKDCGERLKYAIKQNNISQKELATKTNFSAQYISNIVNGKKPMTITAAKLFSQNLGVSESYLLGESDYTDDLSDLQREEIRTDGFEYTFKFLLQAFDICYDGIVAENEKGENRYYYSLCPIFSDEKDFHEANYKMQDIDGSLYHPHNIRAILTICGKITEVPFDTFRILLKDIFEYIEFRTKKFASAFTDKEQDILFDLLFTKE